MTKEAKLYHDDAQLAALFAKAQNGWSWSGAWLRLFVKLYVPDWRVRDVSNFHKVLLDGIKDGLQVDDKWYLIHEEIPEVDKANPRVIVTIEEA